MTSFLSLPVELQILILSHLISAASSNDFWLIQPRGVIHILRFVRTRVNTARNIIKACPATKTLILHVCEQRYNADQAKLAAQDLAWEQRKVISLNLGPTQRRRRSGPMTTRMEAMKRCTIQLEACLRWPLVLKKIERM
jgi:hypothetical protein